MTDLYVIALDAVLASIIVEWDGLDPKEQAVRRQDFATALRDAGFVHLDRRCVNALQRGMRREKASGDRARESVRRERPVTQLPDSVRADTSEIDDAAEVAVGDLEEIETIGGGEGDPGEDEDDREEPQG